MAKYNDGDPAGEAWEIATSARMDESSELAAAFRWWGPGIAAIGAFGVLVVLWIVGTVTPTGSTDISPFATLVPAAIPFAVIIAGLTIAAAHVHLDLRAERHGWRFNRESLRVFTEIRAHRKNLIAYGLSLGKRQEAAMRGRTKEEIATTARMDECTRLAVAIRRWGLVNVILGAISFVVAAWIVGAGGRTANTEIVAAFIYIIPFVLLVWGMTQLALFVYLKARAARYGRQVDGEMGPRLERS